MQKSFHFWGLILIGMLLIQACGLNRSSSNAIQTINLDTLSISPKPKQYIYRASEKRTHDLIHSKLEVRFNWEKRHLIGKASISARPYFHASDQIALDAKGFDIHEIALIDSIGKYHQLSYEYDSLLLSIQLDKTYQRTDTFQLFIHYTAKPDERKTSSGTAIASDKGLYFINADKSHPYKPQQIWTQGETESSSCWFPTIDAPNERMTHEVYMTVDTAFTTLSNGTLLFQTENGDGTRTDYWKQDLPHAPYLVVMAVGEFAMVEEEWKGIPVNYYVEPPYKAYATSIFPKTKEMLSFYSEKLGVPYPWEKYSQIVVRDYVSGAMENTTAVIFGEFAQGDDRYLIDNSAEDVVAHELIHHWFGDLVTCESWSNLPLNESFATYGEYLWFEHRYGKERADFHLHKDMEAYLDEAEYESKKLIRFHYEDRGDMFDAHSYQKGGRILHLLRDYVGDEVFFEGLKHYLNKHQYTAVEIHDLRLAFESVSGEDLNWFFNQWFLGKGHPELRIDWSYDDQAKEVIVEIKQTQTEPEKPFILPLAIDIYEGGERRRENVRLKKKREVFRFASASLPDLVNVDAKKILLGEKDEQKTVEAWAFMYRNAQNFMDRYEAIEALEEGKDSLAVATVLSALKDSSWAIRELAVSALEKAIKKQKSAAYKALVKLATNDPKSDVRREAIAMLEEHFLNETPISLFETAVDDRSYLVAGEALKAMYEKGVFIKDYERSIKKARSMEQTSNPNLLEAISHVYAEEGDSSDADFFPKAILRSNVYEQYDLTNNYGAYLLSQPDEIVAEGLPIINEVASEASIWWVRLSGITALIQLKDRYETQLNNSENRLNSGLIAEVVDYGKLSESARKMIAKIDGYLKALEAKETHEELMGMFR